MGLLGDLYEIYPGAEIKTYPRAFVSFTVADTSGTLYQLATGRRTAILVDVNISRRAGGNGFLRVGEGDFTQRLPDLPYISGQNTPYSILDGSLPIFTFEADITARATVAAAADNDVRVLVTVLEF